MTKKTKLNSKNPKYHKIDKNLPKIKKKIKLGTKFKVYAVFLEDKK